MRTVLLIVLLAVGACAGTSMTRGSTNDDDLPSGQGVGGPREGMGGTTRVPLANAGAGAGGSYPGGCGGIHGTQACGDGAGNGGTGGTGQESGGSPMTHPLITGSEGCPEEATGFNYYAACPDEEVACVYRGVPGPYYQTQPFLCTCTPGGSWACSNSDENGETHCPTSTTDLPGTCDPALVPNGCYVLIGGGFAMGTCSCSCQDSGLSDGGAAGAPSWRWQCAC
jgi:hypothetical protein